MATQVDPELISFGHTKSTPIYREIPPEELRADLIDSAQEKIKARKMDIVAKRTSPPSPPDAVNCSGEEPY